MESKAKVKFSTGTGMSGSIEGNIPGVCQELFNMIPEATLRTKVIAEITASHERMLSYEAESAPSMPHIE